jgi:hypothetical protein
MRTEPAAQSQTNGTAASYSAPRSGLPLFPLFIPSTDTAIVLQRWKKCIWQFENLLISLREFNSTIRRVLLLTYVGKASNDIFDILPDTGTTCETVVQSLTQYFTPHRNKDVAIFEFHKLTRQQWDLNAVLSKTQNRSNRLWICIQRRRDQNTNYPQDTRSEIAKVSPSRKHRLKSFDSAWKLIGN